MSHSDFTLPHFTCIVCHRKRYGKPPLCLYCMERTDSRSIRRDSYAIHGRRRNAGRLIKKQVVHHIVMEGKIDKRDIPLLERLAGNRVSITYMYDIAYKRQHGRCVKCRRRNLRLRVLPEYDYRGIKRLICNKCLQHALRIDTQSASCYNNTTTPLVSKEKECHHQ